MRTVWRFDLPMEEIKEKAGLFTLELPIGAVPLAVDVQQRAPFAASMWVLLDDDEKRTMQKEFLFVGTGAQGHEPPAAKSSYVGTFQDMGFVWHVFEQ